MENLPIQAPDRLKLIRMLGKQPLDAGVDQRVWLIYVAAFALHPIGDGTPFDDLKSDLATLDLEAFATRMQSRWPRALDASDVAGARRVLFDLVDRNLERLEAKLEAYRSVAGEQAASMAGRLAFDQSPDGERLRRFELACQRRKQRCQDAFWKYRREMERTEAGVNSGRRAEDSGRRTEDRAEGGGRSGGGGRRGPAGGNRRILRRK